MLTKALCGQSLIQYFSKNYPVSNMQINFLGCAPFIVHSKMLLISILTIQVLLRFAPTDLPKPHKANCTKDEQEKKVITLPHMPSSKQLTHLVTKVIADDHQSPPTFSLQKILQHQFEVECENCSHPTTIKNCRLSPPYFNTLEPPLQSLTPLVWVSS